MAVKFTKEGLEIPDQTPVEVPVGCGPGETLEQTMRRMMGEFWNEQQQNSAETETFEEANDFDIPEEDEWKSPYELVELTEEEPDEREEATEKVEERVATETGGKTVGSDPPGAGKRAKPAKKSVPPKSSGERKTEDVEQVEEKLGDV